MDNAIAALLVERGQALFRADACRVTFTNNERADDLLNDLEKHPHAFVLACAMDRQVKAERAWLIPYLISQRIGDFSFSRLLALSLKDVHQLFIEPEALHRFPEKMSAIFHDALQEIANSYGGDASRIWRDEPPSAEVVLRFLRFRGVGPKIATMSANILARDFKVPFADYYSIDVSVDVHVRRVFKRLGLVPEGATLEEIVYCARALHPDFPGLLDFPAWEIGRTWCSPSKPRCDGCYARSICPTGADVLASAD